MKDYWPVLVLVGFVAFEAVCKLIAYFEDKRLRKEHDDGTT